MKIINRGILEKEEIEAINKILDADCEELTHCGLCPLHVRGYGCLKEICEIALVDSEVK